METWKTTWQGVIPAANFLDSKVKEIEKYKDCTQMFKATNQLFSQTKPNITVHDPNGRILTNNLMKVQRSSVWFQSQFSQPTGQALTCEDIPKDPLSYPITDLEVKDALHRLNNNRASGPDEVTGELLKYSADESVHHWLTSLAKRLKKDNLWTWVKVFSFPYRNLTNRKAH